MTMKKFFVYALGALALLAVSCNKENNNAVADAPSTLDYAQVIEFSTPVVLDGYLINSIELTEASRYIVVYTVPETKADFGADILFGEYTFANGVFNLGSLGTMTISGSTVSITPTGGVTVEATAKITPTHTTDQDILNASRNWKFSKLIIGISGSDSSGQEFGVEKVFNALDLQEICTWANKWGVSIDDETIQSASKYTVKEICMTAAGSFVVVFAGADPLYGQYSLKDNSLSYVLDMDDIPFLDGGKLAGSVSFSGSTCTMALLASITYDGNTYSASLEAAFEEVK